MLTIVTKTPNPEIEHLFMFLYICKLKEVNEEIHMALGFNSRFSSNTPNSNSNNNNRSNANVETAGTLASNVETAGTLAFLGDGQFSFGGVETAGTVAFSGVETAGTVAFGGVETAGTVAFSGDCGGASFGGDCSGSFSSFG